MLVIDVQTCHRAIVLHAQINFTSLSIRHANYGFNQVFVRQALAIAFEFAG
jgi:hypothetical protein